MKPQWQATAGDQSTTGADDLTEEIVLAHPSCCAEKDAGCNTHLVAH